MGTAVVRASQSGSATTTTQTHKQSTFQFVKRWALFSGSCAAETKSGRENEREREKSCRQSVSQTKSIFVCSSAVQGTFNSSLTLNHNRERMREQVTTTLSFGGNREPSSQWLFSPGFVIPGCLCSGRHTCTPLSSRKICSRSSVELKSIFYLSARKCNYNKFSIKKGDIRVSERVNVISFSVCLTTLPANCARSSTK